MDTLNDFFAQLPERFNADQAGDMEAAIQFDLDGAGGGQWWAKIAGGAIETGAGAVEAPAMTLKCAAADWAAITQGELNPVSAFMQGKIKIEGDMSLAMKLQALFGL